MSATNARVKFLAFVAENGWALDPDETLRRKVSGTHRYGHDAQWEDVQNPFAFVRHVFDDETGQWAGKWHIVLDYSTNTGYSTGTGTTLRRVILHHTPVEGERYLIGELRSYGISRRRYRQSDLFEVAGRGSDGETIYDAHNNEISLRARAEKLVRDPALTAWLAKEDEHQRKVREAEQEAQRVREYEERARPLPVTVEQDKYGSPWKSLARKLEYAAQQVERANGQSDLPALIAKVDEALGDVIHVLNPEARAALDELMAPDYNVHDADVVSGRGF